MAEKACAWCEKGECWTHGQIEKPEGAGKGGKKAKKNNGGGKALVGAVGGGKATGKGKVMQMMSAMASKGSGKAQIMQMMMSMMGASGGQGQASATSWKAELNTAYAKANKAVAPKALFVYDTNPSDEGFTSTLTSESFSGAHEGSGASKKAAEDAAAQAAVEAEFPDYVAKTVQAPGKQAFAGMSGWMGGGAVEEAGPQQILPWRAQLNVAFGKTHKGVTKDCITYTSEHNEAEKNYVSVVSSEKFSDSYTGEPGKSTKEGHDNAAKVAMEAEFSAEYEALVKVMPKSHKGLKKVLKAQAPGTKRKHGEDGEEIELDPKTHLNSAMGWMAREHGPITKGMVVYATTEAEDTTTATVTITLAAGKPKTFTGEPEAGTSKASKKKAESNAASAALNAMKVQISAAEKRHKVAKAEKDEVAKEKWKVLLATKQEEKKLEKEAKKAKTAE